MSTHGLLKVSENKIPDFCENKRHDCNVHSWENTSCTNVDQRKKKKVYVVDYYKSANFDSVTKEFNLIQLLRKDQLLFLN